MKRRFEAIKTRNSTIALDRFFIILAIILFGNGLFAQETANIFQWPDGKKMAISLTFDDARLSQVDKGISLLDIFFVYDCITTDQ